LRQLHITAGVALVDDQQLRLAVKHQAIGELSVGLRFRQGGEQRCGAGEEDGVARFDDGPAEGDGQVRFADAGRAKDQDIFRWVRKRPVASSRTRR
jgi:hypothetical protein